MSEFENPAGMTVNERLFTKGLFDEFNRAWSNEDLEKLRQIMAAIELPDYDVTLLYR